MPFPVSYRYDNVTNMARQEQLQEQEVLQGPLYIATVFISVAYRQTNKRTKGILEILKTSIYQAIV